MIFYLKMRSQLERDEKRSRFLYYDRFNIPTIGIGRNLRRPLSEDEIDYLFKNDYDDHYKELEEALPWAAELDEARFGALLNMTFNMGVPRLLGFVNMLAALKAGDYEAAGNHAMNSLWYSQVGTRGPRVVQQLKTGVWN